MSTPTAAIPASAPTLAPLRKSTRLSKPPAYLQDYPCAVALTSIPKPLSGGPYDIADGLTYSHLKPDYQSYLLTVNSYHQEPQFFYQAVKDPFWREAMDKEIQALEKNHT